MYVLYPSLNSIIHKSLSDMEATISLVVTYEKGDSTTVIQVEADESVENVKALVEAMVRPTVGDGRRFCALVC